MLIQLKFGYFLAKIEQFWPFEEISIFDSKTACILVSRIKYRFFTVTSTTCASNGTGNTYYYGAPYDIKRFTITISSKPTFNQIALFLA
jgi:hypothetical protein